MGTWAWARPFLELGSLSTHAGPRPSLPRPAPVSLEFLPSDGETEAQGCQGFTGRGCRKTRGGDTAYMHPIIAHLRCFPHVCGRSDRPLLSPGPQFPHLSQTNPPKWPAGVAAGQTRLILCIAIPAHRAQGPLPCPRGGEGRASSRPSAGSDPSSAAYRPRGLGQVAPWIRASAPPPTARTQSPEDCGCDYC